MAVGHVLSIKKVTGTFLTLSSRALNVVAINLSMLCALHMKLWLLLKIWPWSWGINNPRIFLVPLFFQWIDFCKQQRIKVSVSVRGASDSALDSEMQTWDSLTGPSKSYGTQVLRSVGIICLSLPWQCCRVLLDVGLHMIKYTENRCGLINIIW